MTTSRNTVQILCKIWTSGICLRHRGQNRQCAQIPSLQGASKGFTCWKDARETKQKSKDTDYSHQGKLISIWTQCARIQIQMLISTWLHKKSTPQENITFIHSALDFENSTSCLPWWTRLACAYVCSQNYATQIFKNVLFLSAVYVKWRTISSIRRPAMWYSQNNAWGLWKSRPWTPPSFVPLFCTIPFQ